MDLKMSIVIFLPAIVALFVIIYWFKSDFLEFKLKVEKRLDDIERKQK